ncbi:hypothetical protein MTR_8g088395 [Medicago truncatula]|uniref:Uncharacterized protein n=1 Tax=Medicago truncatula TaxID=3880 RepID=A0A072TT63_MEDTR|nr:hypothetical protein MTR_8g088395 [Medicago truncatula]
MALTNYPCSTMGGANVLKRTTLNNDSIPLSDYNEEGILFFSHGFLHCSKEC